MATKEEIIAGLQYTVEQGKRTIGLLADGEWDEKRAGGWTPREVFSHLAASAAVVPQFASMMQNAGEDTDLGAGIDINAMNAQSVSSMASMSTDQLMQAFEANYAKLIDFVKAAPDDLLARKARFLSNPMPVSDILANAIVLHGIHHVYEAASRP